jgi:cell filamentation protein
VAVTGRWDLARLQAFHRHIFQDVYHWAGQLRTVDISKGGDLFCRPQFIKSAAADIFADLARADHLQGLE